MPDITPLSAPVRTVPPGENSALRKATDALEAEFLNEMLDAAGVGKTSETFGGGIGEEQFASFLRREQATEMIRHGGIGLSESIFNALSRKSGNDS